VRRKQKFSVGENAKRGQLAKGQMATKKSRRGNSRRKKAEDIEDKATQETHQEVKKEKENRRNTLYISYFFRD